MRTQRGGENQQRIVRPIRRQLLAGEQAFQVRIERLNAILLSHAAQSLSVRGESPMQRGQCAMQERLDRTLTPLHDPGDFLVPQFLAEP
jgi:hypothetical protein